MFCILSIPQFCLRFCPRPALKREKAGSRQAAEPNSLCVPHFLLASKNLSLHSSQTQGNSRVSRMEHQTPSVFPGNFRKRKVLGTLCFPFCLPENLVQANLPPGSSLPDPPVAPPPAPSPRGLQSCLKVRQVRHRAPPRPRYTVVHNMRLRADPYRCQITDHFGHQPHPGFRLLAG